MISLFAILKARCDTKSCNKLLETATPSIWSNPTVTCETGNYLVGKLTAKFDN